MLTPALPPQAVPVFGGFDYVTVDAQRRRVYAAHGGSRALLIVDADSGKVLGQVRVGPMAGVAVDPATGHVFTGNGGGNSISEVDPVAMTVLRTVEMSGPVDAITYDPATAHIYGDEDNGTHVFVVDAKSFKLIKTITVPGHKPEYLAVDPQTHEVYQNIDDLSEIAVIDPTSLTVARTIQTPEIKANHPLQYDAEYHQIVVGGTSSTGGTNGILSAYTRAGKKIASVTVPRFDQCTLDPSQHVLACAGGGGITRLRAVFTVWSNRDGSGDFVQKFIPGEPVKG